MNNIIKCIIIVTILCLIITIILSVEYFISTPKHNYSTISYKVSDNCNYMMTQNLKEFLEQNNVYTNSTDSGVNTVIHIPCTYDSPKTEIKKMNLDKNKINYVFILTDPDSAVAKDYLWKNLLTYYGLEKTLDLVPMTYVIKNKEDANRFKEEYDENKIYIMKKNVQRQSGLKLTKSFNDIYKNKDNYIVAQELLKNPYLIKGRKINLRVYVLVSCYQDKYSVYVYNNGFMYYTKDLYKENSLENGPNITTGYVDRWIYDVHPLTHEDFRNYLDNTDRELYYKEVEVKKNNMKISNYLFNNIYKLIKNVFTAFYKKIGNGEELHDNLSFQLFGLDIAVDRNLEPKLMEINKGPDLDSKDERDGQVKKGLIRDIFKTLNIITDEKSNGFIKVLDI